MESLKELLTPKTFNKLSFVAVVFSILLGVTLCGIFADIENSESRFDFRCDAPLNKDFIRGRCFGEYGKKYNKLSIPVYGFVLMNISVMAIVSVIYSQSVKSSIHELETGNQDVEGLRQRGNPAQRRLFISYCCQLTTRFVLAIVFIFLQTQVFYPRNFPSNFNCNLMKEGTNTSAYLSANVTQQTQTYKCYNQRATKKTFWTDAVAVVNGIFAFLALIETLWILSRARNGKTFMEDSQFYADHLKSNRDPQQEQRRQQNTEAVPLMLSLPQEALEQPSQLRTEHLPAALQNKEPGKGPKPKDLDIEEAVPLMLSLPQEALEQPSQLRTEHLPAALQNEEPGEGPKPKDLDIEEAVPLTLSLPQEVLEQPSQLRTEYLPAALQNEEPGEGPKPKDLDIEEAVPLTLSLPQEALEQPSQLHTAHLPAALQNEEPGEGPKPKDLDIEEAVPLMLSLPQEALEQPSQLRTEHLPAALQNKEPGKGPKPKDLDIEEAVPLMLSLPQEALEQPSQLRTEHLPAALQNEEPGEGPKPKDLDIEEAVPLTLSLPQETLEKPSQIRTEQLPAALQNEEPGEGPKPKDLDIKEAVPLTLSLPQETLEQPSQIRTEQLPAALQSQQPSQKLQADLKSLKDGIIAGTKQLRDLKQPIRPNPGEGPKPKDLETDQINVNLVIHEGRATYDFPEDRREQLKVYPKPNTDQCECVPVENIIDGNKKNVLVVGRPGIGKTMLSTKLLRVSAFDAFKYVNFDVAFLLKFRRFNSVTDLDLRELLARSETVRHIDDEVWDYIIKNPTKVLLIFDGIDEFSAKSDIAKDNSGYNDTVTEKMPLHCLYNKIASGKLLPGATVITTIRPTAVSCLTLLNVDRTVEVLGFTSEQVEDYVEKFTESDHDPDAKETIWQHISTNINLFSLCYIPVNCFIICSCLSLLYIFGSSLPTKLTKIYCIALKIFFFRHNDEYRRQSQDAYDQLIFKRFKELPSPVQEVFNRLANIAFVGIIEGRLVFTSREVEGLEDCGLLHRLPDVAGPTPLDPSEPQFCFMHLTVQEFLAAKHVTDTMKRDELREFVADHIKQGSWQVVMQFVAGLLDTNTAGEMPNGNIFTELLPTSTFEEKDDEVMSEDPHYAEEESTTLTCWPVVHEKELALNLCKCLYELDVKLQSAVARKIEEINFNAVDFTDCRLVPVDCTAIIGFLKNANRKLFFRLTGNNIGWLGCMEIQKWIVKSDRSEGDLKLRTLNLSRNGTGDKGAAQLRDALKDENCKLTVLNLRSNEIGYKGAVNLSDALKNVHCKLTVLDLYDNEIGDKGAANLSDTLKDANCKLTELYLSSNKIGDKGAANLSDALQDPNCKLTKLTLSDNNIGHKGAAQLCDALKDFNCKLTFLELYYNNIGGKGAADLSDALKNVHCKLTVLDLGSNEIGHNGAAHLSDALKDSNCKLTVLKLDGNNIGDKGAANLRGALKDANCKLTELNLGDNNI